MGRGPAAHAPFHFSIPLQRGLPLLQLNSPKPSGRDACDYLDKGA